MANGFHLRILTPAGAALEADVNEVYLPASQGEIGVLPGHTKYTGLLGTGVLSFVESGHTLATRVVISEGFCSFADDVLTVLTDSVDFAEDIDRDLLLKSKDEAATKLAGIDPIDPNWKANKALLDRIEALERIVQ